MKLQFLVSGVFAFIGSGALYSAPDPDLFDGRLSVTTQVSSTTGEGTGEGDKGSGEGEGSSAPSAEVAVEDATGTEGQTTGSGKPGNGLPSAETKTSTTGSGRSFDEFEVGVADEANGQIDIKRSKEFGSQSTPAAKSPDRTMNSQTQRSDQNVSANDSGNQESYDETSTPDYGTNVPSGL